MSSAPARRCLVLAVATAAALAASVAASAAASAQSQHSASRSGATLVVANAGSLSDVGTAASLVAAGAGDAVLLAAAADEMGAVSSRLVGDFEPARMLLVGGEATLSAAIESELRELVNGIGIERLAGRDRLHTAALAARHAFDEGSAATVVIANGWSLPDVATAASAVASGAADVVL